MKRRERIWKWTYNYTQEEFVEAVKNSHNLSEVCRTLNLNEELNVTRVKRLIQRLNLDTSHFITDYSDKINSGNLPEINPLDIFKKDSRYKSAFVRKKLFSLNIREQKCQCCGLTEYMGVRLTLQLHHIKRNDDIQYRDNRLENLIILCPNCHKLCHSKRIDAIPEQLQNAIMSVQEHAQEEYEHLSENPYYYRDLKKDKKYCKCCGKEIVGNNKNQKQYCSKDCFYKDNHRGPYKPTKEEIIEAFEKVKTFNGVSRILKCANSTVYLWCMEYGIFEEMHSKYVSD